MLGLVIGLDDVCIAFFEDFFSKMIPQHRRSFFRQIWLDLKPFWCEAVIEHLKAMKYEDLAHIPSFL